MARKPVKPPQPSWRDAEWERISRLAGVDPDSGQVLPPEPVPINREPMPMWRNRYYIFDD